MQHLDISNTLEHWNNDFTNRRVDKWAIEVLVWLPMLDLKVASFRSGFFVCSYSHSAYLDYGGTYFCLVPVRSPLGGGTLQGLPSTQACPARERIDAHREDHKGKDIGDRDRNERTEGNTPVPYSSPTEAMKEGIGRTAVAPLRHPDPRPLTFSPLPALCAPGAPIPSPRTSHLPQPEPAFPHP